MTEYEELLMHELAEDMATIDRRLADLDLSGRRVLVALLSLAAALLRGHSSGAAEEMQYIRDTMGTVNACMDTLERQPEAIPNLLITLAKSASLSRPTGS